MITRRPARFGKKLKLFTHTFIFVSFGVFLCFFFFAIYKNISITELTPMNEGALSTKV